MRFIITILLFSSLLSAKTTEFIVAPDGLAGNPGTQDSPTTFISAIEQASKLLKAGSLPSTGVKITLNSGIYPITQVITLNSEFRGTADAPIIISAAPGENVTFDGRVNVKRAELFSSVTDPEERKRLAKSAAEKIRVITVRHPAMIRMLSNKLMLQLNYDDTGFSPAMYPNEGYAKLAGKAAIEEPSPPGVPKKAQDYGIRAGHKPFLETGKNRGWLGSLQEPRGAHTKIAEGADQMSGAWKQWEYELARDNSRNAMVGFYEAVWKLSSMPIYSINAEQETLRLSRAFAYGFGWLENRGGQPFRIFGLLPELDKPGEWYFDTKTNRLFIYPVKPITADSKIGLPVADGFLKLKGNTHVKIIGLNVRNIGKGIVYDIDGGENNLVANCSVYNSTATGVRIRGRNNGVLGCDFYDLDRHVNLSGLEYSQVTTYTNNDSRSINSNRIVLCGNYVENCHFYQKKFTHEKINISMGGTGQIFRNNLVHNSIGQAMMVRGNDQLIELNEFFNIGYEEGDGGAVYSGNDLTGYGNTYQHNFFHHLIRTPGKHGRAGIHLDDFQAGASCIGNVFFKSCNQGIYMNGGAGNTILGNVFLEGNRGAFNRGNWGEKAYQQYLDIETNPNSKHIDAKEDYVGRAEKLVGKEGWNKLPWSKKYPLFKKIMNEKGRFGRLWPIYCTFKNNMYYGNALNKTELAAYPKELLAKTVMENDMLVSKSIFVDYDNMNFAFSDPPKNVDTIPFQKIGLYLGEYRSVMPDKQHYRIAMKKFFENDDSHSINRPIKKFNSAALVESSPKAKR